MKKKKRCIVVAQGFYEWLKKNNGKEKIPHFIKRKDGQLMCFAGLYDCVHFDGKSILVSKGLNVRMLGCGIIISWSTLPLLVYTGLPCCYECNHYIIHFITQEIVQKDLSGSDHLRCHVLLS